jgi:hypothetical protein
MLRGSERLLRLCQRFRSQFAMGRGFLDRRRCQSRFWARRLRRPGSDFLPGLATPAGRAWPRAKNGVGRRRSAVSIPRALGLLAARPAAAAQRTRTRQGGVRRRFGRYRLEFQRTLRRPNSWPGRRRRCAPTLQPAMLRAPAPHHGRSRHPLALAAHPAEGPRRR